MTNKVLFTESQKFNLRMEWLIIPVFNFGIFYLICEQIYLEKKYITALSDGILMFLAITIFIFSYSYLTSRIDLEIRERGVYYRFYPFQIEFRKCFWTDLIEAQVREYDSREFGGSGYGMRVYNKNGALILSCSKGLQLETKSGRKLLIGTQKPEELEALIRQLSSEPNHF